MFTIVFTGFIATAVMTLFMHLCALITKSPLLPVRILTVMIGRMTGQKNAEKEPFLFLFIATTLHYLIGVGFVAIYYWYQSGKNPPGAKNALDPWLFGVIIGIVAVIGWRIFVSLHPAPPSRVPWPIYLLCIFAGHIIFAVITEVCLRFLQPS